MQRSLASKIVAWAASSAVTSNILRWFSRTTLTRSIVDNCAAGTAGVSSFSSISVSSTGVSSAGEAATAAKDDPAGREVGGAGGGFVLLELLELEGVRLDEVSPPLSSAVSR